MDYTEQPADGPVVPDHRGHRRGRATTWVTSPGTSAPGGCTEQRRPSPRLRERGAPARCGHAARGVSLSPSITDQRPRAVQRRTAAGARQPGDADGSPTPMTTHRMPSAQQPPVVRADGRARSTAPTRTSRSRSSTSPRARLARRPSTTTTSSAVRAVQLLHAGIGHSANGTTFLTYSESSDATPPAVKPQHSTRRSVPGPDHDRRERRELRRARWGDFAGSHRSVLRGHDAVWQAHEVATASGGWRTVVSRLVMDVTPPTATAPTQALVRYSTLGRRDLAGLCAGRRVLDRIRYGSGITAPISTSTSSAPVTGRR